jgi:myo-inositol-1(or 4)-monophosphatase
MHNHGQIPADEALRAYKQTAVTLTDAAGARITTTFGRTLSMRYESGALADQFHNPVSEVDQDVEQLIRALIGEGFTGHDILGGEVQFAARLS